MGGKWSKSSMSGWPTIRERMRQAEPAADGVGAVSRDLEHKARELHPEYYKDC
nr:nef protein [Human immunodeficiency virus 1]